MQQQQQQQPEQVQEQQQEEQPQKTFEPEMLFGALDNLIVQAELEMADDAEQEVKPEKPDNDFAPWWQEVEETAYPQGQEQTEELMQWEEEQSITEQEGQSFPQPLTDQQKRFEEEVAQQMRWA
eukprot:419289-Ditylum_brightwellii.AAC.1